MNTILTTETTETRRQDRAPLGTDTLSDDTRRVGIVDEETLESDPWDSETRVLIPQAAFERPFLEGRDIAALGLVTIMTLAPLAALPLGF